MLRKRFAFDGVIFSDDLSMEGASVAGSVIDGAHAALRAGCDMVLICNAPDKADMLLDNLDESVRAAAVAADSARRILRLTPGEGAPDWATLQRDPRYRKACKAAKSLAFS